MGDLEKMCDLCVVCICVCLYRPGMDVLSEWNFVSDGGRVNELKTSMCKCHMISN